MAELFSYLHCGPSQKRVWNIHNKHSRNVEVLDMCCSHCHSRKPDIRCVVPVFSGPLLVMEERFFISFSSLIMTLVIFFWLFYFYFSYLYLVKCCALIFRASCQYTQAHLRNLIGHLHHQFFIIKSAKA